MEDKFSNVPTFSEFFEIMQSWPLQTQVGLFMFAAIWIVGINTITFRSHKRRGSPWWKYFLPTASDFKGLNKNEWLAIGILLIASLGFGIWGMMGQTQ
jgi:hypothetical protein